jgi:hypothetical protein
VVQLYPRALDSLSIASYDSQGFGGGILTRLHTGSVMFYVSVSISDSGKSDSISNVKEIDHKLTKLRNMCENAT